MSSTEERNAKDDLALCDKATPGPWGICLGSGAHVCTGVMQDGEEDFGTMICDCLPDYFVDMADAVQRLPIEVLILTFG